jgi:hypothetical protein
MKNTSSSINIIGLIIIVLCFTGWIKNIIKLSNCDFEPSYRSEVLRIIGIPVAPMGIVIGYMDLTDEKQVNTNKNK